MDDKELISHLQEFGISKNECEMYIGLLNTGPTRASNVSSVIQMNRVKGYKILENLKNIGIVSSTFSTPTTYSANELEGSLQNLLNTKKFDVERLEKIKNTILESYETPAPQYTLNENPQFSIISGRQNIFVRIEKMIKEETKEMCIVSTYDDLSMMYYTSIPECIKKSQKNGVIIKVVTELEKGQNSEIIDRMKIQNIRIANLPSKGRIVCNSAETLISGYTAGKTSSNSLADSTFLTNSDEFVNNMMCFTNQLWKSGKDFYPKQKQEVRI